MTTPPKYSTPTPSVSLTTLPISGLLVDIHGLSELAPSATRITCLWLHHPRGTTKARMVDIAARAVYEWNKSPSASRTGLIALAWDQRNHGTRLIHEVSNESWKKGNETHAQDMFGMVSGAVVDQGILLDAVGGYLFRERRDRVIDRHLALGVSLGGHSVWQTIFREERVRAGVMVVACPDYMCLMEERAKRSKLATCQEGAFLGSRDFPPELVAACEKFDPKALLFGTAPVGGTAEEARAALEKKVGGRLDGKSFLICSGEDDKLVPYARGKAFIEWFVNTAEPWRRDHDVSIENHVYAGVGHWFDEKMAIDAVRFIVSHVEDSVPSPRI
ncbi:hypothetical protein OQA88_3426 [Cercophora sp. LCS_1]